MASNGHEPLVKTIAVIGHNVVSTSIADALAKDEAISTIYVVTSIIQDQDVPIGRSGKIQHIRASLSATQDIASALASLNVKPGLLISTHHGGDYELQTSIIEAAVQTGIPRFIPAEFSHDALSSLVQERLPPHRTRARVVNYLRQQDRLEWVGLATGYPLTQRLRDGHMGIDLTWQSATVYGSGDEAVAGSSLAFVGEAVSAVVRHWARVRNRYICIAGMTTSTNEILRQLEHQAGKDVTAVFVEKEKCMEEAERRMQGGWPDAGMFLIERSLLAEEEAAAGFRRDEDVRGVLGLRTESLEGVVHHVLHDVKRHGKGGCGCV